MKQQTLWTPSDPPFDADRLFSLIKDQGIDVLLVSSRHNTRYLTGGYFYPLFMWDSHTRRTRHLSFLAIVPGSLKNAFFVGRPGENDVMNEEQVWISPRYDSPEIGSLSTVTVVSEQLRKRALDKGRIAVELSSLSAESFSALSRELPHAEFVEANTILDPLRAIKLPREIEIIRDGSRRNLDGVRAALAAGVEGETTSQIENRVRAEFRQRDLHFLYSLICAGPHFFRASSEKRRWESGRPLHIDSGGLLEGYVVETCRMGFLGTPSGPADELLNACSDLRDDVLKMFKPGIPVREVQRHAEDYLGRTRFGDIGKFIAHGIGMVHHEDPVVSLESQDTLEKGMVLSIEMEYRQVGLGHIKVEELVVVTGDGFEIITPDGGQWTLASG